MTRAKFDQQACDTLGDCVHEIESFSDAELVIVVRARSGQYAHADYLFGAILSFVVLLFLLFSPYEFHRIWVAFDAVVFFVIGSFIASRSPTLRRLLTTNKARAAAVRTAAAAMFYEAGIANTEAEMGLLIYLSLLERRLELIADRGILKAVPSGKWNEILFELRRAGNQPDVETFLAGVRNLGSLLAEYLPATGVNPNELPDLPQFDLK